MSQTNQKNNHQDVASIKPKARFKLNTREITFIGLLGALSMVLMLFRFPLPLMPPFMSFDFSGVVEITGGLLLGPVPALLIIVVKILLQIIIQGSNSAYTGELQNFILSCSFVMPAAILYWTHKTKKRAIVGMLIGCVTCSIVASFSNLYLIIPFYAKAYGMDMNSIIAMCTKVNPLVKTPLSFVALGVVPFNLIKTGICSAITFILYKHISKPIKRIIHVS